MLALLSLNAKGLTSQQKQFCLQEYAENLHSSVLFLQETNLELNAAMIHQDFVFFMNPPVQPCSGVAIAFKTPIYQEMKILQESSPVPGYLQMIHATLRDCSYHFINVYMPQANNVAIMVVNQIHQYLSNVKNDEVVLMGGDWNTTLHKEDRKNCSEIRTQLANQIEVLMHHFSLTDVWRNLNPEKQQFTYRGLHKNCPMARLDRFYIMNKHMHRVNCSKIVPSFSDHDGVTVELSSFKCNYKSPYWKLDLSLFTSFEYNEIIKNIILFFKEKSEQENSDIVSLWDKLKEEVSTASQRYTFKLRQETQEKLYILVSQINYIEEKEDLSRNDSKLLIQLRQEISSIYNSSASEKVKFSESQVIHEANTQSKFFLRLAKQAKPSATLNQLNINGEITSDPELIFPEVQKYFKKEFSNEDDLQEINTSSPLYQDLPSLSQVDAHKCEEQISEKEILDSINAAQPNRAPGLDGLPIEFYKLFWEDLKSLLLKLIQNFQQSGLLPASLKKIVIKPTPKPGDRSQLINWRPISLINTDYKIISRIFSRRISAVVSSLLLSDQSYCVPGRTIYNNLHLIRNIINHANRTNSSLGVLALDQSGAFNKISHKYLKHLLEIHNFGPSLRRCITTLISQTKGFVKIASSLLVPFCFTNGVLQGDPLAGILYIISFEPLLRIAAKMMASSGYPIPNSGLVIRSTAYADDVHFFVTENEDFENITQAFNLYSQESRAQLNTTKSKGLFCGKWKTRTDKPLDCDWSTEGIKALGVYLGTPQWEQENWKTLIIKIKGTFNRWSQYLKLTSYHGRRIICNQLACSQLIHTLTILDPPRNFIQEVQKAMNNFTWQGKHWLHQNYLYAATELGGIGLLHLEAKIKSLRLNLAHEILNNYNSEEPGFLFHYYNMSLFGDSSPIHFFLKQPNQIEMLNLEQFYLSIFNAWLNIKPILVTTTFPLQVLRETPLQGSILIDTNLFKILPEWKNNGYHKLGQLITEERTWIDLQLEDRTSVPTQRRLFANYQQIKNFFENKISSEHDCQIKFKFIVPSTNEEVSFPGTRKQRYEAILKGYLNKPEVNGKPTWIDKQINWSNIFKYPIDRIDSNTTWRLLHNALVTPRKLHQWNIIPSGSCLWCNEPEANLMHMFFQCSVTKPIWNFVSIKLAIINESPLPTFEQLLVGYPEDNPRARLSNFILVLARSTIYRCYMSVIKQQSPPDPCYLKMLKLRLKYRMALEQHFANLNRKQQTFKETFLINNALQNI